MDRAKRAAEKTSLRPVFRVGGAEILPLGGAGSVPKASSMLPCERGNSGNGSADDGAARTRCANAPCGVETCESDPEGR